MALEVTSCTSPIASRCNPIQPSRKESTVVQKTILYISYKPKRKSHRHTLSPYRIPPPPPPPPCISRPARPSVEKLHSRPVSPLFVFALALLYSSTSVQGDVRTVPILFNRFFFPFLFCPVPLPLYFVLPLVLRVPRFVPLPPVLLVHLPFAAPCAGRNHLYTEPSRPMKSYPDRVSNRIESLVFLSAYYTYSILARPVPVISSSSSVAVSPHYITFLLSVHSSFHPFFHSSSFPPILSSLHSAALPSHSPYPI